MQLINKNEVERIEFDDGTWFDIKSSFSVADYDKAAELKTSGEAGTVVATLAIGITGWNMQDGDKPAELNLENISRLPGEVATKLFLEINKKGRSLPKVKA
jgi:hypothetical protein